MEEVVHDFDLGAVSDSQPRQHECHLGILTDYSKWDAVLALEAWAFGEKSLAGEAFLASLQIGSKPGRNVRA
jgi:hypothetical protein